MRRQVDDEPDKCSTLEPDQFDGVAIWSTWCAVSASSRSSRRRSRDACRDRGAHLLDGLRTLQQERPELISNARGKGLLCAMDLPDGAMRTHRDAMYQNGAIILVVGAESALPPPLDSRWPSSTRRSS